LLFTDQSDEENNLAQTSRNQRIVHVNFPVATTGKRIANTIGLS